MTGKSRSRRMHLRKRTRLYLMMTVILPVLAGMTAAYVFTYDEKPRVEPAMTSVINEGSDQMDQNPLTECQEEEVKHAAEKYYERLAENTAYIEAYENLQVYWKNGRKKGTYVLFVRYDMKIQDIYTAVPGLGTLYLEKTDGDRLKLNAAVSDEELQKFIAKITEHEDVQELFAQVEEAYARAVQSDAMLADAVNGLQAAASENEPLE